MDIVDPAGSSAATARNLAVRPGSLEGVTIALLDNSKPNAKALLERLGALVAAKSGARAVRVLGGAYVACIGPVTASAARALGLTVHLEPAEHSIPGLVAALEAGVRDSTGSGKPT